jgi:SAM-dependent methyltransferase
MELRAYYEIDTLEQYHWWFVGRRAIIKQFLKTFVRKKVPLALDVGCGTGFNMKVLSEYADTVVGWEPSALARSIAHKKYPKIRVEPIVFPCVPTDEIGRYNLLTLFDVLEHIEDDTEAFRAIEALLAPGGIALVTVPAFPFLWSTHDDTMHHYRRYRSSSLQKLVTTHTGLHVVRSTYFNTLFFPLISVIRSAKKVFQSEHSTSDFATGSSPFLNRILTVLFSAERFVLPYVTLPVGVSIILVLRKDYHA